jgi:hypothetical protein
MRQTIGRGEAGERQTFAIEHRQSHNVRIELYLGLCRYGEHRQYRHYGPDESTGAEKAKSSDAPQFCSSKIGSQYNNTARIA